MVESVNKVSSLKKYRSKSYRAKGKRYRPFRLPPSPSYRNKSEVSSFDHKNEHTFYQVYLDKFG